MARDTLTTMEYALLGLLGMSPGSGYDVHKVFEGTPLAHFSSSPGAIYPALKRLARAGLLEEEMDRAVEARPRRVYSLSEQGEARLEEWLREEVTREELIRKPGAALLRFSLMESRLSKAEVVSYLRGFREVVAAYVEELKTYREMAEGGGLHGLLALENGIAGYECDLKWIDRAMAAVEGRGARDRARRKGR
jgi:DNA-binding PadR family transcriptional regulator